MEDEKDKEETPTRGNEWEVVTLTASTYAAAPGPESSQPIDDHDNESSREEDDISRAMFMSGHFVFPPSQHENLPLEPIDNEIRIVPGSEVGSNESSLNVEKGDKSEKMTEENWTVEGLKEAEEVRGIQLFDDKGENFSGHGTEFGAGKALEGLNLVEEEQIIYNSHKFSSLLGEADIRGTTLRDENLVTPELSRSVDPDLGSSDSLRSLSPTREHKSKKPGLPCDAWWKRQAASFYAQAKEANAFWSVFVAAALMGIVILGQRWQQERWQSLQSNINEEKVNRMLGPLSRFKDVIVGGHRQGSVIRGVASAER